MRQKVVSKKPSLSSGLYFNRRSRSTVPFEFKDVIRQLVGTADSAGSDSNGMERFANKKQQ